MFQKINLDHCYNPDQNFKFLKKLKRFGFNLDSMTVEHPGKAICKFIMLQSSNKRKRFYLEFIHVKKGGKLIKIPGFSFNFSENIEVLFRKLSKTMQVVLTHKNYNWKVNSTDRLPGWNMLSFNKPPISNIFTWFTEYEKSKTRKRLHKLKTHPNSVYSIHGIKLILSDKSKANLEKILSKKLKNKNKLSDGTYLYIEIGRKDKFETIILNCKSLTRAKRYLKNCELGKFEQQEAFYIASDNSKKMWNLAIIEN